MEDDAQALDLDQRRSSSCLARAPRCWLDAGIDGGAIGDPGRVLARRQEGAEMHPALAADLLRAARARRSGSAWSSTRRSSSDHSSSPWISSAADCLPRLSPPAASPACIAAISRRAKGQAGIGDIGLCGVVEHGGAGQHVAGDRKAVALDVPAPVDAFAAGMRGDAALGIHDVQLPALAAVIGRRSGSRRCRRVHVPRAAASRRRCRNRD